ncbi:MAG TPA: ABC transporter substrate-binding protein [Chloroflexota bacterium]|jgi:4,5-dihydroxyphthalate decarboxylase
MKLRYGGAVYDRTAALALGAVRPEGVELDYVVDLPNQIFRRMFDTAEFDVSEMSGGNYLTALARGERRFVGLPIFPSRVFRYGSIYVNVDAGLERAEDLRGRRLGVPEYGQTATVWVRAMLAHEHGLHARDLTWVRGTTEKVAFEPPPGVTIEDAPAGRTLSDMLVAGEIDALASPEKPECFVAGSPRVRRLYPDFTEMDVAYYRRTGHFPIMHMMVMRRQIYEADRALPRRLYDAFVAAKTMAYELLGRTGVLHTSLAFQTAAYEQQRAVLGDDPFAYGVAATRPTVEALAGYVHEQGLAPRRVSVEDLFVPELLDT